MSRLIRLLLNLTDEPGERRCPSESFVASCNWSCAPTVFFVSHSIRRVVITTLGTSLLLQVAYFGSVLFLVWRASCNRRAVERTGQKACDSDYSYCAWPGRHFAWLGTAISD
ncbi:exopolysaccharide production repressor protein [Sinorhizobium meliloti]|uniref:exopolysaccharide production repressor protein n=1 Tax=Rhizobium meliloti TaxID=382 RepID=UPI003077AAFF